MDSVDYVNTFITVAPDSSATEGTVPPAKETPTVAERTFRLISEHPYVYRSGDVIFDVWADRKGIPESDRESARAEFYSKGQPCLRSSDLGKRYGWGVHADSDGRIAVYGVETAEYSRLAQGIDLHGEAVGVTSAMRSSRGA